MFCRVTGFAGTTQVATQDEADEAAQFAQSAGGRTFSIRFDSNTAPDMPWTFRPAQVTDTVAVGERDMAIFIARNNSDQPITGTATFNVEPDQAGAYFNKIQCFCFTAQTLQPGEEVRMPVLYYIDPSVTRRPEHEGRPADHPVLHLPPRQDRRLSLWTARITASKGWHQHEHQDRRTWPAPRTTSTTSCRPTSGR